MFRAHLSTSVCTQLLASCLCFIVLGRGSLRLTAALHFLQFTRECRTCQLLLPFCFGAEDFSWSLNVSPGQLVLALNLSAATGNLFV
jgi:hypothetical protein